jgi:hypothetical protein
MTDEPSGLIQIEWTPDSIQEVHIICTIGDHCLDQAMPLVQAVFHMASHTNPLNEPVEQPNVFQL